MSKALRLAIYSGNIPSTTFIERLIEGVANSGHKVLLFGVLSRKPKYQAGIEVLGYRNSKMAKLFYLWRYSILLLLFNFKRKQQLDCFLKEENRNDLYSKVKYYPIIWHKPDIFHLQWAKGIAEWEWVQMFGIKLVVSFRGAHINYSPLADKNLAEIYRQSFPKVNAFHAVSEAIALEAQKYGAKKERIQVVYSGLDILNIDRPLGHYRNSGVFRLLSVGRSHWKKGYVYALDACAILKKMDFNFKYTIIGGKDSIELMYQIRDLGLEDNVELFGQVSFETVKTIITEADLLLLSSVEEGIANVVLEAMALGTLVLSTDCGGMNEVIENERNGFLVPICDPKAIANAINSISILSSSKRQDILSAAKSTILHHHSNEKMVADMLDLYNSVLNIK